jgi:hypothetical protein
MRKGTVTALLMGVSMSILPCYGAISSQTDWLDVPEVIAADYEWQVIPSAWDTESIAAWLKERKTSEHTHDDDVLRNWWEADYTNDPLIPDEIEEAAIIYGEMFNICPEFLEAICDKETGGTYRCDLIDSTGLCYGPMQINIKAQSERIADYGLTEDDMLTADGGMIVAASYIAELFEKYEDPAEVLMRYNGASTALREYHRSGKLNYYTRHVLEKAQELQEKHNRL